MYIDKDNLSEDLWDVIRTYLNVSQITDLVKIVGPNAKSFTKDASGKDFLVIYDPEIECIQFTLSKKRYPYLLTLEIVSTSEEKLKTIMDLVRKRINFILEDLRNEKYLSIQNQSINEKTGDSETRDNVRIVKKTITIEGFFDEV